MVTTRLPLRLWYRSPFYVDLWRYRELLRTLVTRDLKVKYGRSVLGFVWTLLNPLITVLVLVAVFSQVVRIAIPQFWAFLLSGYFVWRFIQQTLSSGAYLLVQHGNLRRSARFPQELLIVASAATRLVEFLVEIVLVLAILAILHHSAVPQSFLIVPVLILLQIAITIGLLLPLATLSVFYRDVQHAVSPALLTLFYASPVFYSVDLVPEGFRGVYLLNPVAALLTLFHQALYEGVMPSLALFGGTATAACIVVLMGYAFFRHYKPVLAEIA